MNINFNLLLQKLFPFIIIFLFSYLLNSVLFLFLPKTGIEFKNGEIPALEYKKYSGFYSDVEVIQPKAEIKKTQIETFSKYTLKAIYSTSSNGGWVIVQNSDNSTILSQWDEVDGYILTKLFKNYVIFEKAAKEYRLEIKQQENISYEISQTVDDIKERIVVKDDVVTIDRKYLNSYVSDINKVWNDIAINEVKNGDTIEGFAISKVNENSVFKKLGLKNGDIIKSVNNNTLASYADAFKIYNNINNTKYLSIEILRNNEVMELNYEID